jgi:hypothetical protein
MKKEYDDIYIECLKMILSQKATWILTKPRIASNNIDMTINFRAWRTVPHTPELIMNIINRAGGKTHNPATRVIKIYTHRMHYEASSAQSVH